MKLKIVLVVSSAILFQFFLISCEKYLSAKSTTEVAVPTSLEDLQGLLDGPNFMNRKLTPGMGEVCADDNFLFQSDFDRISSSPEDQAFYLWQKMPYYFPNDWSASYKPVFIANLCLQQLKTIDRTDANKESWDMIKGAAMFYRSYSFLNLLWNHAKAYNAVSSNADLGIVLRLGADFNEQSVRSSVEEGYQQVISDTRNSIALLPLKPYHPYRPSKIAAYGLLARTYLSMRNYDSAYYYANMLLNIKNDLLDYAQLSVSTGMPVITENPEMIYYSEMYAVFRALGGYADTLLFSSYSANDFRKTYFFRASKGYYKFKRTYAEQGRFSGIAVDEMILVRAECAARLGMLAESASDMNYLLKNRIDSTFVPLQFTSKREAIGFILDERRKELIYRGLRWIDIKRLNLEGAGIIIRRYVNGTVYTLNPEDSYYALPIPEDIIELTGMPQNP